LEKPAPGQITIRNTEPHELDDVAHVILSSYEEYASRLPADAWEQYSANILDVRSRLGESELLVAVQDGSFVGSATFFLMGEGRDGVIWPDDWTGIRLVAVKPENRGQGIGKLLMDECISRSREQGAAAVGLHTTPLMTVAAGMYERMGFVRATEFEELSPESTTMAYKLVLR